MNLVPVSIDAILIGHPLPCALRAEGGVLLAAQGYMVTSRKGLDLVLGRRSQIYIDSDQSDNFQRAYINRINNLVLQDRSLGQIAEVQISPYDIKRGPVAEASDEPSCRLTRSVTVTGAMEAAPTGTRTVSWVE